MQTVVETPSYLRAASIFSETERADIISMVAADPDCGEVMPGTGGFRKVRVGRDGIGNAVELESSTSSEARNFPSS
jgi:hypothetical protein